MWGKFECFGFCATRVDDITKINFRFSRRHPWRGSVHTYRPHKWGGATLAPNPFPLTKSRTRGKNMSIDRGKALAIGFMALIAQALWLAPVNIGWPLGATLGVALMLWKERRNPEVTSSIQKPTKQTFYYIMIGLCILFISGWMLSLVSGPTENQQAIETSMKTLGSVRLGLAVVVIAPLVEEYVFRHLLVGPDGSMTRLIIISLFFGYEHMGQMSLIPFTYYSAMGVVLGLCYLRGDKLTTSVPLHMIYNAIGFGLMVM